MVHVNVSSTNFNKSMSNAYTPSVCMNDKEVKTKRYDPKDDYLANLDDSSDKEEINQATETFKNITRMQIKNALERSELLEKDTSKHLVEGKSVLLHSLGRIYFNVPFNDRYQELKSKFFKKATILPEKQKILNNYKVEPNCSNREKRKQIQREIKVERPTFEYTEKNILTAIQPLQQQLVTQKLINRNETRLFRNGNFEKRNMIYNNHITVTYTRALQSGSFSEGYAGGECILKDLVVKINDKIETYKQISEQIKNGKDIAIATKILNIAKNGTQPEDETQEKILSERLYMLLLTVEPSRSPAALINNIQMLELIADGKMTFKEAFVGEKNTPMMPMAASEIVKTSTTLQRKYVYNDNFVYPCHYLPHTAFGTLIFGKQENLNYRGKDLNIYPEDLNALQLAESNILDKWLKMKIEKYLVNNKKLVDKIFKKINSDKDKNDYIDIVVEEIEATMKKYGLEAKGLEVGKKTKLEQIVKKYEQAISIKKTNKGVTQVESLD